MATKRADITPEIIKAKWDEGLSGKQIAQALACGETTVYRYLERAGVDVDARRGLYVGSMTPEQREQCVVDYRGGMTLQAVAAKYSVTPGAIRRWLAKAEEPVRPHEHKPHERDPEVVQRVLALRGQGWSQMRIAEEVGWSQPTVGRVLRSAGQPVRRTALRSEGTYSSSGYIYEWVPRGDLHAAMRNSQGYVAQHRLVMARSLGRDLRAEETVHHIDGDRTHNDISNLQLRQGAHGAGIVMACRSCGSHDIGPVEIGG